MIQYKPFVDYKSDTVSNKLLSPSQTYWYNLDDVLKWYIRLNDNKFDYYNEGIAYRKHIIINLMRYIGKESNDVEEASIFGINDDSYLEYEKI